MQKREAIKHCAAFALIVIILGAITLSLATFFSLNNKVSPTAAQNIRTVVIDAGHGGMDGGAVAPDGTAEKDINLNIAHKLALLMRVSGYNVVMTRSEDVMLDTGESKGSAKMRDLKKRLEISSEYSDAITVSIHCNKFPQSSCKGMQVYHSDSQTAQAAAKLVQSSYLALMPENHRQIKKADSSIYLLDRAVSPAILVECGFLSNSEELQKLKDENYQKKLAIIIMSGVDAAYEI